MTSNPQEPPQQDYPQLDQLFNAQTVRAQISVDNWQDAIQAAGRLLVESGGTQPGYVDAMERVMRELGPYAVMAPGIVLLHARPEDGVLLPCMVLMTLSTPVCFGHSQNDPVDIVLALGAVDKKTHIQALQQLAGFLGDPLFLEKLRLAQDDPALLSVIQNWVSVS
jgi:mannitol/fructose-specific phosphotransferase system IIA component (Ntr-type)